MRRHLRLALAVLGLVGTIWMLQTAGQGLLGAPPVRSTAAARAWLAERDAATTAMAFLRLLALAMAWYLLGTTLIAAVAGRRIDAITIPALRGLVHGFAGVTLTAGAATLAMSPGPVRPAASLDADVATMRWLPAVAPGAELMRRLPGAGLEWMYAVDPPRPDDADGTATLVVLPDAPAPQPTPDRAPMATHAIASGESFWSITEELLTDALNRPVTDQEIAIYWRRLIELNRPGLVDPDNEDLILPGHVITLLPVTPT